MAEPPLTNPRRVRLLAALLWTVGLALYTATRLLHPIRKIGNADIAGILYEADIILDGGLPYVDTVEMKSPGTFFLFAAIFRFLGRDYTFVQWVYFAWGLLGALAVWVGARALHGRDERGALVAAGAAMLYLTTIPLFDLNYSAWMTTAYAWAAASVLVALRGARRWHVYAGVWAAAALLLKGHAVVLAPVFASMWWWARRRGWPGATWHAWPLWLLGAELAFLPLMVLYGARGALPELLGGVFPIETARGYSERIQPDGNWVWMALVRVPRQMSRVFPLLTWLGLAACVGVAWEARRARRPGADALPLDPVAPQLLLLAWSVVGCGLGGTRYYIHYLTQYVPALALLGAHPAAYRWTLGLRGRQRWAVLPTAAVLAVAGLQLGRDVLAVAAGKAARVDHRGEPNAEKVGAYIHKRTRPEECIQVWGWIAWSVYFWADRRACTPVYKVLGQITDYNQNGLLTRSRRADFIPGANAERMLAMFRERPPAFFVRTTPFFPGVKEDPLEQFTALNDIFRRDYVLRRKFGRLSVYEHVGRLSARELRKLRKRVAKPPGTRR